MDLGLIINLVSGLAGGNMAGTLLKKYSMGPVVNSILGILGGGLGSKILGMLGMGAVAATGGDGGLDIMSIVSSLVSGGVGGGALMTIIGIVKGMLNKG